MGGESNFLFQFDTASEFLLSQVPDQAWVLDDMKSWTEDAISELLDVAEGALREYVI